MLGRFVDNAGARFELLDPVAIGHLDLDLRIRIEVSKPEWVMRRAAFRRDDHIRVAVASVYEGSRDRLPALRPSGGHQQGVVTPRPDAPSVLLVELCDRFLVER